MWWAEVALEAGAPLYAYCPHPDQPKLWRPSDRRRWQAILDAATEVIWIAGEDEPWSNKFLFKRNAAMIGTADEAVAVLKPSRTSGGTFHCVKAIRARTPRIPLVTIDLEKLVTERHDPADDTPAGGSAAPTSSSA